MEIFFALLHTLCGLHFSEALYAIYHSKVEQDYLRMRRDFQRPDPLELTNDLRRVQLCDKVLKANSYFYERYSDEFRAASRRTSGGSKSKQQSVNRRNAQLQHFNSASASDAFKFQYNIKYVLVGTVPTRMRAFLCSEGKRAELFVTFGFRDEHAFLLTKAKNADESELRIRAMLAPTPKLVTHISFGVTNGHRHRHRHRPVLDDYFWQFFPPRPDYNKAQHYHVLEFMQLCWLADDEYRHMEVCSSVANTLHKYEHFQDLHLEITKSNYVKRMTTSAHCIDRPLLDDRTGDQVNVRVLPCALNRNSWSYPQFYLLRDPNLNFQSSVFVLRANHRGGALTLDAYISDVSSLTDARRTDNSG